MNQNLDLRNDNIDRYMNYHQRDLCHSSYDTNNDTYIYMNDETIHYVKDDPTLLYYMECRKSRSLSSMQIYPLYFSRINNY